MSEQLPPEQHPPTGQWAPVNQSPYFAQPGPAPSGGRSGGMTAVIVLLAVLIALIVAGGGIAAGFLLGRQPNEQGEPVELTTVMETVTAAKQPADGAGRGQAKPAQPSKSSFSFSGLDVAGPTSWQFAYQVKADVESYYRRNGIFPSSVTSYSTVTGKNYTMTCEDIGAGLHCYGGRDAHVYLYD
ncbi:flagellar basal body-associated FliL family protein [Corynebacterium uterequi]|uniref:Uncharacterized protein n=1 Tax=Corynebacterium uterequi TaxID=1072256 RepID=A0A0G3HAD2_9CORY|nr:hypothetical protein [Corynebacterium uterequi]AKK10321.1 hypothetical protein CUTER_01525 [Corynebacterium uterequi]